LVKEYFDSSVKTMDFCTELENRVTRARTSQMHIPATITHFEKEGELQDGMREKKCVKDIRRITEVCGGWQSIYPEVLLAVPISSCRTPCQGK